MSQFPTLLDTLKKELVSIKSIIAVFIISFFYFSFSAFLLNNRLVFQTIFSDSPLIYKITLYSNLVLGMSSALSKLDFLILLLNSFLVGANILFIFKIIKNLKTGGKVAFSVGGTTVVAIISTGCASCGLSVLSILGLFSSFYFLPFNLIVLHFIAVILLIFSLLYSLKTYHQKIVCKIK